MKFNLKKDYYKIIIAAVLALLIAPQLYAIYYSVPASDDFAMALGRVGQDSLISEYFHNLDFFWNNRGGTIVAFATEILLNPLNLHVHLGHAYGVFMIVAYLLCLACIIYGIRGIVMYIMCRDQSGFNLTREQHIQLGVITVTILATMLCTYYYVEAHNWYVGMMAYQLPMAMEFLFFGHTVRFAKTASNSSLVVLIIAGIIAANNTVMDVPVGLFYVLVIYLCQGINTESRKYRIKRSIPLLVCIVAGVAGVLAPGNFVRQSQYTEKPGLMESGVQAVADVIYRLKFILLGHPFTVALFILLILLGFIVNNQVQIRKIRLWQIIALGLVIAVGWVGSVLPYVYGRGFTTTYLDVRVQYVLDYFIEMGIGTICLMCGLWLGALCSRPVSRRVMAGVLAVFALCTCGYMLSGQHIYSISQVDLYCSSGLLPADYDLWNGILYEIETSDADEVEVVREYNIPWCKFFLYSGMESGETYAVDLDCIYDKQQILPNVYYQKKAITVWYPEE